VEPALPRGALANAWRTPLAALALIVTMAGTSLAQGMPAAAREAFERGVLAAEQQQLPLALRYFKQAQDAAPFVPGVLFNLGLTHGKLGHELIAIAWLRAYLAATPGAANAGAVRREITRLDVVAEGKIGLVLQEALKAASLTKNRQEAMKNVRWRQASVGDIDEAVKGGTRMADAWFAYALAVAKAGLVEKAHAASGRLFDPELRSRVYFALATQFTDGLGDCTGEGLSSREARAAWDAVDRIEDRAIKTSAFPYVFCHDLRPENLRAAEANLVELFSKQFESGMRAVYGDVFALDSMIGARREQGDRLLRELLRRYAVAGDFASATRIVDWALRADPEPGASYALSVVVDAQLRQGDLEGAKATARKVVAATKHRALRALAEVVLGNTGPARELMAAAGCRSNAMAGGVTSWYHLHQPRVSWIVLTQMLLGDRAAAEAALSWAGCPADSMSSAIAAARLANGDVAGAVRSLKEEEAFLQSTRYFAPEQVWPTVSYLLRRARSAAEIAAIEKLIPPTLRPEDAWARVRVLTAVADAYAERQAQADARRALVEAGRQLVKANTLDRVHAADVRRILKAAAAADNGALARDVQALVDRQPSPLVVRLVKMALDLSADEDTADIAKAVRTAGAESSQGAAEQLSYVAERLGHRMFVLRALGERGAEP
jgi:tetratricopeptide (TPR) repeat protein